MKKNLIIFGMAALIAASCTTTKKVSVTDINGEWTVEKINGTALNKETAENEVFLGFDTTKNAIYGCTGCNRLTGTFNVIDNSIDLSKVGSTRMMCHDMTTETLMLQALQQVKTFKTDKNTKLMLTDQNGKTVIELKKKQ